MFNLSTYDCIGFDLDNTLCEYDEMQLIQLIYDILSTYMVNEKNYSKEIIQPLDIDFIRKGLTLDLERGNVMDLGFDGTVLKATHGTTLLSSDEIRKIYGHNKKWCLGAHHCKNFLATWNGELSEKIRSCMDYFDMAVPLLFARCVDSVDATEDSITKYTIWPDIHSALNYMFANEHFSTNLGEYFPTLKNDPLKYLKKNSDNLLKWLKALKSQGKLLFLITGSDTQYGSFIADIVLGNDWRSYFDLVVFYARKPGFFVQKRPFCEANVEMSEIEIEDLKCNSCYSQGNWTDLMTLFQKETGKGKPKCVYIGDNLVQDVFAPCVFKDCHTVAVVKELAAECRLEDEYFKLFTSKFWGSFFYSKPEDKYTIWGHLIEEYAQICIPHLEWLVNQPIDANLTRFKSTDTSGKKRDLAGYQDLIPECFN